MRVKIESTIGIWKPGTSVTMVKQHQCPWFPGGIQHPYSKSISLPLSIELGVCPLDATEPCGTQTTILTIYLGDTKSLARHKKWTIILRVKTSRYPGEKNTVPDDIKSKQENRELGNPTCELHFTGSKEGDADPLLFIQPVLFCFVAGHYPRFWTPQ